MKIADIKIREFSQTFEVSMIVTKEKKEVSIDSLDEADTIKVPFEVKAHWNCPACGMLSIINFVANEQTLYCERCEVRFNGVRK